MILEKYMAINKTTETQISVHTNTKSLIYPIWYISIESEQIPDEGPEQRVFLRKMLGFF